MNKHRLSTLMTVNLRYVNPQATEKSRKKGKNGLALTKDIIKQYVISGLIFLAIYGVTMFFIDFSKMPGFFTYYTALFVLLAFSQGITVIYNVFFESKDLPAYIPLPFQEIEIFIAKILIVTLTILPFVFPLWIVLFLTSWRSGVFFLLSLIWSLSLFLLILGTVFSFCSLIVFGLTRTAVFKQHKKVVTSLLLGASMLITIGGILFMNRYSTGNQNGTGLVDRDPIGWLMPIYNASHAPLSTAGLISILGLLILFLGLLGLLKWKILPKLYEQMTLFTTASGESKRKYKANQNLSQLLRRYNNQLLKEPNLIMQVLSSSLLMPLIFIAMIAFNGHLKLTGLEFKFIGVVFFSGIVLASMTINSTSFISNLISMDQENFDFICSLPISLRYYLKQKFNIGFQLQLVLNIGIGLIAGLIINLPFLMLLVLLLGVFLGTYMVCLKYFSRDFHLRMFNWTSISQLFTRGSGNVGLILTMFGSILIGMLLVGVYIFLIMTFNVLFINLIVLTLIGIVSLLWVRHYQKNFWGKITE